jgi:cell division septum initiation protein DivIVA
VTDTIDTNETRLRVIESCEKGDETVNIIGNVTRDDVVVLGGHEFKRVKNGLDEAQVISFIDDLIKERDKLAQSQDHIASLNRLAERSIVEADKLAMQIRTEAAEQAKAESAAIVDKAKEQARQMAEKKIAEAAKLANEEADAIKAKAEEEAARLLENQKNKIRGELRNLVNQQSGYLLEELERLKQQAAAIQADFDNRSSEFGEEKRTATVEVAQKRDGSAAEIAEQSDTMVAQVIDKTPGERPHQPEPTWRTPDDAEKKFESSGLLPMEEQVESGKPQWEVEILPPFEIGKIMEVVSFLDQLPEVANTEMIVPQIDAPLILVFLRRPINVVDVLQKVPAVAYVEDVTSKIAATNGKPRKVRISLSGDK